MGCSEEPFRKIRIPATIAEDAVLMVSGAVQARLLLATLSAAFEGPPMREVVVPRANLASACGIRDAATLKHVPLLPAVDVLRDGVRLALVETSYVNGRVVRLTMGADWIREVAGRTEAVSIPATELASYGTRAGLLLALRVGAWMRGDAVSRVVNDLRLVAGRVEGMTPSEVWRSALVPGLADLRRVNGSVDVDLEPTYSGSRLRRVTLKARRLSAAPNRRRVDPAVAQATPKTARYPEPFALPVGPALEPLPPVDMPREERIAAIRDQLARGVFDNAANVASARANGMLDGPDEGDGEDFGEADA